MNLASYRTASFVADCVERYYRDVGKSITRLKLVSLLPGNPGFLISHRKFLSVGGCFIAWIDFKSRNTSRDQNELPLIFTISIQNTLVQYELQRIESTKRDLRLFLWHYKRVGRSAPRVQSLKSPKPRRLLSEIEHADFALESVSEELLEQKTALSLVLKKFFRNGANSVPLQAFVDDANAVFDAAALEVDKARKIIEIHADTVVNLDKETREIWRLRLAWLALFLAIGVGIGSVYVSSFATYLSADIAGNKCASEGFTSFIYKVFWLQSGNC